MAVRRASSSVAEKWFSKKGAVQIASAWHLHGKTKIVHISTAGRSSAAAVPDVLQIDKDEQDE